MLLLSLISPLVSLVLLVLRRESLDGDVDDDIPRIAEEGPAAIVEHYQQ